jgi:hypothetical protein
VGGDGVPTTEGHLVMPAPDKIAMENVNSPGRVARVDADKYGSAQETEIYVR